MCERFILVTASDPEVWTHSAEDSHAEGDGRQELRELGSSPTLL